MNSQIKRLEFEFIILGILIISSLFIIGISSGRTIVVDDDGPADYSTIEDAISNADDGDVIRVYNGTYNEQFRVHDKITLRGNGSAETIIDWGGENNVIIVSENDVEITGFQIRNSGDRDAGIRIESENVTIRNVMIRNCTYGIRLNEASHCIIENITCTNTERGIYLRDSHDNVIHNNFASNNTRYGIYCYKSNNNSIENNTCNENGYYGIATHSESNYNYIINNSCKGNIIAGINIDGSTYSTCSNNEMYENGLRIGGYELEYWNSHNIDSSNTVNSKKIFYFKDAVSLDASSDCGQLILANCSNSVIDNKEISNTSSGILIGYCKNISIKNITSSNNSQGIAVYNSEHIDIHGGYFSFNGNGIRIEDSSYCNISTSIFSNNKMGMYLPFCRSISIFDTIIIENVNRGAFLQWSDDSVVENCTIEKNGHGLAIEGLQRITILNNFIVNNQIGIQVTGDSENNIARGNDIVGNSEYGINATHNNGIAIDAKNNWWGHPSGPFSSDDHPDGRGDEITENIEFDPWSYHSLSSKTLFVADYGDDTTGNGSEENPFMTIQKGVDSSNEWDTIRVFEGEYKENIVVDKSLEIIGLGVSTIINGDDNKPIMQIFANHTIIRNFTIINGKSTGITSSGNYNSFKNNIFFNNTCAIKIEGSSYDDHLVEKMNVTYGGMDYDYLRDAVPTHDGGYVMVGDTSSYGDSRDVWMIKVDENGEEEWDTIFGGGKVISVKMSSKPRMEIF